MEDEERVQPFRALAALPDGPNVYPNTHASLRKALRDLMGLFWPPRADMHIKLKYITYEFKKGLRIQTGNIKNNSEWG